MSGLGAVSVDRLRDAVVNFARNGRRKVGGNASRDSRTALLADRTRTAIDLLSYRAAELVFSYLQERPPRESGGEV